jgi:hypothetical protein
MKKILLLMTVLFAFFFVLSAQITQEKADEIVLEYIFNQGGITRLVYAKEGVQQGMTIATSFGEVLELDYNCWVYYVSISAYSCLYLIVNESNGNLLEVKINSNHDYDPDVHDWRPVVIEIPALVNTKWNFVGMVDVQTNILTEPEVNSYYQLYFFTEGFVVTHFMICTYTSLSYEEGNSIRFFYFFVPHLYDEDYIEEDRILFLQTFFGARSYSLQENELKLYYNNGKNYSLFTKIIE